MCTERATLHMSGRPFRLLVRLTIEQFPQFLLVIEICAFKGFLYPYTQKVVDKQFLLATYRATQESDLVGPASSGALCISLNGDTILLEMLCTG